MTPTDDELDARWREGLAGAAPTVPAPDRARVEARGARRGRTRFVVAAAGAFVVIVLVIVVVVAAPAGRVHVAPLDSPETSTVPARVEQRVVVTIDNSGLHASPASAHAGPVEFSFLDRRRGPLTVVSLRYEVQPNVGGATIADAGGRATILLCPHQWFLAVVGGGVVQSRIPFDVTGTDSECTTPIT